MPDTLEYQKIKAKDKCVDCPNKPELGRVRCRKCLDRINNWRKLKTSTGNCVCGKPAVKNKKRCATCLQQEADRAKTKRASRKSQNACIQCGKPANGVHCQIHAEQAAAHKVNYRSGTKYIVLSHYSKGEPACSCCGEKIFDMLTIDHIAGGGNKHRQEVCGGKGGTPFYRWLINHRFLEGFRVLCYNCNISAAHNGGICKHVTGDTDAYRNTQETTDDSNNRQVASTNGCCL